jgi:hypothetical protein
MNTSRTWTLIGLIFLAALSRLVPHPWNIAPITGMALFAGSYFRSRTWAFVVPLLALFVGDCFLGFYSTIGSTYAAFAIIVMLGFWIGEKRTLARIGGATLLGSVLFFGVTNAATWFFSGMYTRDIQGFATCFTLAIPFFRNTLLGDLFYSTALFGGFALAARVAPTLKFSSVAP